MGRGADFIDEHGIISKAVLALSVLPCFNPWINMKTSLFFFLALVLVSCGPKPRVLPAPTEDVMSTDPTASKIPDWVKTDTQKEGMKKAQAAIQQLIELADNPDRYLESGPEPAQQLSWSKYTLTDKKLVQTIERASRVYSRLHMLHTEMRRNKYPQLSTAEAKKKNDEEQESYKFVTVPVINNTREEFAEILVELEKEIMKP